jgi:hypothetical protein
MRNFLAALFVILALLTTPISANPPQKTPPPRTASPGRPDVKVWVNTRSGVYHCPGTRYYGNTKQGEYMTQKQAQDKGYRPAYGRVCR